jgi:DNA polymerase III gamma/tau subunit
MFDIKYKPQTLDEVVGNHKYIDEICKWIENYENEEHKILIINAPHGIGKTLITKLLFKKYNKIDRNKNKVLSNISCIKKLKDNILNMIKTKSIRSLFSNNPHIDGILIDDIDEIYINNSDIMLDIIDILHDYKEKIKFPIICTANIIKKKKIDKLISKSSCKFINFEYPTQEEIILFTDIIIKKENIKINPFILRSIIQYASFDIRKILSILYDFSYKYRNKTINANILSKTFKILLKNNIKIEVFNMALNFFNNTHSINEIINLYNKDKHILPYMIHENYINVIFNKKTNKINKLKKICECANNMSQFEKFDTYMYNDLLNSDYNIINIYAINNCLFNDSLNNAIRIEKILKHTTIKNKIGNHFKNKKEINSLILNYKLSYINILFISEYIICCYLHKDIDKERKKLKELLEIYRKCELQEILKINKFNENNNKKLLYYLKK